MQALAEAGHLQGAPGAYRLARPIDDWPIPDSVHALLAARIDRLPEESKNLLQTAAVIGQEFHPEELAALLPPEATAVESLLTALETAGFLLPDTRLAGSRYAFRHPLLREVAYSGQLEAQRARTHEQLARALEQQHPSREGGNAASVRIAHHWQHAGNWARAGEWNLQAARWAASRDTRISVEQQQLALRHLDLAPDSPELRGLRVAARAGLIRTCLLYTSPSPRD